MDTNKVKREDAILNLAQKMLDNPELQISSKVMSQDAIEHLERYDSESNSWTAIKSEEIKVGMQLRCVGEVKSAYDGWEYPWKNHEFGTVTEITHTDDGEIAFGVSNGGMDSIISSFDYSEKYNELYRNANSRGLEVDDLIKILSMDNADGKMSTWDKMKEYVNAQEITEDEKNRILNVIDHRGSKEDWENNWKKIFEDISNRPAYSPEWEKLREEAANKVKELNDAKRGYQEELRKNKESIGNLEAKIWSEEDRKTLYACEKKIQELSYGGKYKENKDEIDKCKKTIAALKEKAIKNDPQSQEFIARRDQYVNRNKSLYIALSAKTKQVSALTLIESMATSKLEQERNTSRIKERMPLIESLKQSWDLMREREKNYRAVMQELNIGWLDNKKITLNPFERTERRENKEAFEAAKKNVKAFNKEKEKTHNLEKEIIKKAQSISDKDFRKQERLAKLKFWEKGEPLEKPVIRSVEQAQKVIEGSKSLFGIDQKNLEKMKSELENHKQKAAELEKKAVSDLEKVATNCRQRREGVKQAVQHYVDLEKQGKVFDSDIAMSQFEKKVNEALKQTTINRDYMGNGSFARDLEKFMKDHKFGDILEGHEHDDYDRGR